MVMIAAAPPRARRHSSGFTLLELMIVLVIVAVLAAIAGPSFRDFIDNQRLRSASFDLVSDLLLARSEALKRQAVIVVTPVATTSDEWYSGWSVRIGTSTGPVITTRTTIPSTVRFEPTTALSSVTFTADGRTNAIVRINVKLDGASTSHSCVRLDATGRAKSDKGGCA
jgi:type IV fimbrial biogenesis protein FimT